MGKTIKNIGLIGLGMVAGVCVSLQFSASAQKAGAGVLPLEQLRQLTDVFGLIKSDYVEPVDDKKLLTEAMAGMVAGLDPHSAYLDKAAFSDMRDTIEGKFVGVGVEVAMEDGYLKVVAPIEGSPAEKAGIKAGDLITRIDNTTLRGLSQEAAMKKMRGEPHTKATLTLARKDSLKPLVVTIVREEVRIKSVKAKMIEPGYAWLRVAQFQEPTVEEMAARLGELYKQDPRIKGLVLDLRNDPGGVVPGAIGVAAAFLPKDAVIVSSNGQLAESKQVFYGRPEFYANGGDPLAKLPEALKSVPMVVLVNGGSASASEIVAGALQDYQRAIIMGSQTFGKGSMQTVRQISADTAVKLTIARYYTPHGRSIQARGIVPDLAVNETAEGDEFDGLRLREADLDKHLGNLDGKESMPLAERRDELEEEQRLAILSRTHKPLEYGNKDDFQLNQALNHLKGLPVKLAALDPARAAKDAKADAKADLKADAKATAPKADVKSAPKPGPQSAPKPAPAAQQ